jgi:ApeA N-terminal domain 1
MWIYVPDSDSTKESWVGIIKNGEGSKSRLTFELIRHADGPDVFGPPPFQNRPAIGGLLDFQRRCTLIGPAVTDFDSGALGPVADFSRTLVKGEFGALLSGLMIEDLDEPLFTRIEFESDALGAWYAPPAYGTRFDPHSKTHNIEIKKTDLKQFEVLNLGRVRCLYGASVSSEGRASGIRSVFKFQLDFWTPQTLQRTMLTCLGLERLFGFLIGHRGKFPVYTLWVVGDHRFGKIYDLDPCGKLEIGGLNWQDGDVPHPHMCIHSNGMCGATLGSILLRFAESREKILTRMEAVEFSRFFADSLYERFSIVMPVLEEYLKERYTNTSRPIR